MSGSYRRSGLNDEDRRRKADLAKVKKIEAKGKKLALRRDTEGMPFYNALGEQDQQILEDFDGHKFEDRSRALKRRRLETFRLPS